MTTFRIDADNKITALDASEQIEESGGEGETFSSVQELTALLHSRMQHLLERVQDFYGPHPAGEFWVPHRLGGGAPTLAEAARLDAEEASQRAAARASRQRTDPAGASE